MTACPPRERPQARRPPASPRGPSASPILTQSDRQRLLARLVTAQEDERRRVARELHDQTGQALSALLLGLDELRAVSRGRQRALALIASLRAAAEALNRDLLRIALELRPTSLDDLGLHAGLLSYIESWSKRAGIRTAVRLTGFARRRLPGDVETAVYRITQEALTNVIRHSHARSVSVRVSVKPLEVVASVTDDGVGFERAAVMNDGPPAGRLGIIGMRERAALVHGRLDIESRVGGGTTVTVRAPLGAAGPARRPPRAKPFRG